MSLSDTKIADIVAPYLSGTDVPETLYAQLSTYLELLVKWNARTNLTAIREPEEMVRRHFGESLFAGAQIRGLLAPGATLLDFGSGAGFPGLPIQLLLPEVKVTLAESQNKKATFLREAVRTLGIKTEVWAGRVEAMPAGRIFDTVTLRAVDDMENALAQSAPRVAERGIRVVLGGRDVFPGDSGVRSAAVPGTRDSFLYIQDDVPRGT